MAKTDNEIIDLYWERNERAITETDVKYKKYLMTISRNILTSEEDCEENLNDTYLKTWNSLPPERPNILSLYLGKINRLGAIDIWRKSHSQKRAGSEYEICLDELGDLVSGKEDMEEQILAEELGKAINSWLSKLPKDKRITFIGRYYYSDSVKDIAAYTGQSESAVKVMLHRMRQNLKIVLEEEGYSV